MQRLKRIPEEALANARSFWVRLITKLLARFRAKGVESWCSWRMEWEAHFGRTTDVAVK